TFVRMVVTDRQRRGAGEPENLPALDLDARHERHKHRLVVVRMMDDLHVRTRRGLRAGGGKRRQWGLGAGGGECQQRKRQAERQSKRNAKPCPHWVSSLWGEAFIRIERGALHPSCAQPNHPMRAGAAVALRISPRLQAGQKDLPAPSWQAETVVSSARRTRSEARARRNRQMSATDPGGGRREGINAWQSSNSTG